MFITMLHFTVQYYKPIYFTGHYFSELCITLQNGIAFYSLQWNAQYYTMQYSALHCTALHCTSLHCTALQCNSVQFTAVQFSAVQCTPLYFTLQLTGAVSGYHKGSPARPNYADNASIVWRQARRATTNHLFGFPELYFLLQISI